MKQHFNEIKPIADFVFHINVLFHYNSVTNAKKMLYVKDRNLKYVKAKKSLALKKVLMDYFSEKEKLVTGKMN